MEDTAYRGSVQTHNFSNLEFKNAGPFNHLFPCETLTIAMEKVKELEGVQSGQLFAYQQWVNPERAWSPCHHFPPTWGNPMSLQDTLYMNLHRLISFSSSPLSNTHYGENIIFRTTVNQEKAIEKLPVDKASKEKLASLTMSCKQTGWSEFVICDRKLTYHGMLATFSRAYKQIDDGVVLSKDEKLQDKWDHYVKTGWTGKNKQDVINSVIKGVNPIRNALITKKLLTGCPEIRDEDVAIHTRTIIY